MFSTLGLMQTARASLVTLSTQYDRTWITPTTQTYCVQNEVWNPPDNSWVQELQVDDQTGAFTVTESNANNPASAGPVSYPSIYRGSFWGTATTDSGLPYAGERPKC